MPGDLVLEVLARIWAILHAAQVRAAVMGGVAVSAWRHIRATHDVDLLVDLGDEKLMDVLRALQAGGFHCRRMPPILTIGQTRFIQLLHDVPEIALEIRVDLLLADTPFEKQALERTAEFPFEGSDVPIPVVSCEDLLIFKLLAGRIMDRADVAYLLRANRERLDMSYLQNWAQVLGLFSELQEMWRQAFPGEELAPSPE